MSEKATESKQLPVEAFQAMERKDEDQILRELRGEIVEDFVYSMEIDGRKVTNLSYAGIKEAIRRRGGFENLSVTTTETDAEIRALVRVRDLENMVDVVGASTGDKSKPFSYVLAVNKAERNAFAKLIPAKWFAVLIDDWLAKRGITKHGTQEASAESVRSQPPTPVAEEAVPPELLAKDPLPTRIGEAEKVMQFPLVGPANESLGMLNVLADKTRAAIVPEGSIDAEDSALHYFLVSKILVPIKAKHPGFDYRLHVERGKLTAITIRGPLDDQRTKDIASAAKWTFEKALERTTQ